MKSLPAVQVNINIHWFLVNTAGQSFPFRSQDSDVKGLMSPSSLSSLFLVSMLTEWRNTRLKRFRQPGQLQLSWVHFRFVTLKGESSLQNVARSCETGT